VLIERGWIVNILHFPASVIAKRSTLPAGINQVVLTDLSEAHLKQQLAAVVNNYGPIGAFIHLNPLSQDVKDNILGRESEKNILKSVFLIAKHLKKSLTEAAHYGRSCFITVTRFDGELGLGQNQSVKIQNLISGGLFGLTKTLNMEWEHVFCRAIDLSPELGASISAELIIAELYDPNLLITEVGYNFQQERITLGKKSPQFPFGKRGKPSRQLSSDSVFLVSGGGRGITAQCVIRLAEAFPCKFILLGRTQRTVEPGYTQGCIDENELKQRIIKNIQTQGEKPTPVKVQKVLKAILAQREIDETLQAIVQVGGQAKYLSVDITDAAALQDKLTASVERFGSITGIIHGAGVLADKLIEKKTEQDFESVYSTKINGLQSMLACVNDSQLDHLVLFSSAAGFYGNIGQSDYAIANEILNKFAHDYKRQHPACHVVSFNWGPWDGGMVTPELKQMFAQRNIEVIPTEIGTQIVVDNLKTAVSEAVQVLVSSPFTIPERKLEPELQTYRIRRKLTLEANPFLQDHIIGGKAVLPTTCASVWLANTCSVLYPGYQFLSCETYKVLKGIVFDETLASEYIIDLKEINKSQDEIDLTTTIWSETVSGKPHYHYSNQIKLVSQPPTAPYYDAYDNTTDESLAKRLPYQDGTLFHGPRFQGVKRILNISPEKLTVECVLPQVDEKQLGQFPALSFNPIAADVQFQSLLIWVRHFYQAASLPLSCQKGEIFQAIADGETFYVSMEVESSTDTKLVANIMSHDNRGQVFSRVLGAEVTISQQLNHLFVPSSVYDPNTFLPSWREFLEIGKWPGEMLLGALFRRFVGSVVCEDSAEFNSFKGKPVIYLANHQVGIESILFTFGVSALTGCPINVVMKAEHQKSWVGQLLDHLFSYPLLKKPELMFYFDRDNQSSMLELLNNIKKVMIQQRRSLLVHVEGTRVLSCRQPIKHLSAVFIDMAIELNIPIVPVGLVGGLPIEPLETRLEFPVGYTHQTYHLGAAIYPEVLKKLPNAERKTLILERLNQLAETATSSPNTPVHHFEQAVRLWMKQTGDSEVRAVLYKVLEEATTPDVEVRTLLQGIREGYLELSDSPKDRWLGELGQWLTEGKLQISYH
jgi:NAD(P)-dependent dehydrogenase (short-subunit alcohol dehydrogenase family)/1-acyl-sn-glycerol-3-phosphate acyltransferase